MNRSLKAQAICRVFAECKDRVINRKADKSAKAGLYAPAAAAIYRLCGSLRGLLRPVTTGTHTTTFTGHWCSWMSGMQPCQSTVRRRSPVVVKA